MPEILFTRASAGDVKPNLLQRINRLAVTNSAGRAMSFFVHDAGDKIGFVFERQMAAAQNALQMIIN